MLRVPSETQVNAQRPQTYQTRAEIMEKYNYTYPYMWLVNE